jgi:hypothetical protein
MVSKLIEMLRAKRDEAVEAMGRAREASEKADVIFEEAKDAYRLWQKALDEALHDEGVPRDEREIVKEMFARTALGTSIKDLAIGLLTTYDRMTSAEIKYHLDDFGKPTTTNTVTVTLNRHKDVFRRVTVDGELKWALTKKGGRTTT